jgi:hypothetical protein
MAKNIEKKITSVTINYEDGTKTQLEYYALIGFEENTWYDILYSPPKRDAKIKMNNYLADVSNRLIESIGM